MSDSSRRCESIDPSRRWRRSKSQRIRAVRSSKGEGSWIELDHHPDLHKPNLQSDRKSHVVARDRLRHPPLRHRRLHPLRNPSPSAVVTMRVSDGDRQADPLDVAALALLDSVCVCVIWNLETAKRTTKWGNKERMNFAQKKKRSLRFVEIAGLIVITFNLVVIMRRWR